MNFGKNELRVRKRLDFNHGWRFIKEDIPGAHEEDFDDGDWRQVDLPHDWSIEESFRSDLASGTGFLPGGIGWYRKTFRLPDTIQGRGARIEFDGVYKHSEVWCNGVYLGMRPYGYASFAHDLTPHLKADGEQNVIAVRVDHSDHADSRWYTGSGIYRDVQLVLTKQVHIKRHGVFVTTPHVEKDMATVQVKTTIVNRNDVEIEVILATSVHDREGNAIATVESQITVPATREADVTQYITVTSPLLWSPDDPNLYALRSEVRSDKGNGLGCLDDEITPFGIRTFRFDADKGFSLNGESMKLKGLCIHHDAGALGAAVPIQVWERRLWTFKELGCNAIRMSHNPPASNLLDLCDAMGFLVMDEAFDEWEGCKRKWVEGWNKGTPAYHGYSEHFKEWSEVDLQEMVLRDRNHPSVIIWSIGNEIDFVDDPYPPNEPALASIAKRLVSIVKSLDTSRPVTAAMASPETNLYADCLDIAGYNYHEELYERDHAKYPGRVIYGSENLTQPHAWQAVRDNDFIAGLHLWTGIDFLGEADSWPLRNSEAGLLDIAGFKKPIAYLWKSLWTDVPMIHMEYLSGHETEMGPAIACYTNCECVELIDNGKSLGEQRLSENPERILRWSVSARQGALTAVGRNHGTVVCAASWQAPGTPERIRVMQDRRTLVGNGADVAHIEVEVVDANGIRVDDDQRGVVCEVRGPARLIGMENGNPQSHEDYGLNRRQTYQGRLLIFLQSERASGQVEITLTADGLPSANAVIEVEKDVHADAENAAHAQERPMPEQQTSSSS